jgi:WD40 repeat protein
LRFEKFGQALEVAAFIKVLSSVLPAPDRHSHKSPEERAYMTRLAALTLFQDIDVLGSGEVSWVKFIEFVIAKSETLRVQEDSRFKFDFYPSKASCSHRPTGMRCHYDQVYHWPNPTTEAMVIFEEGQPSFHLHHPHTLARKRKIEGHRNELLCAAYLPDPFEWVVTSANDKTVQFWDLGFTSLKRWTFDYVVGNLCWANGIRVLYGADHFTERVHAWRLKDPMAVRELDGPPKPDKHLEFRSGHTKPLACLKWIAPMECLATASLDTTVRLWDTVRNEHTHTLRGHSKGVTCLDYCHGVRLVLSAGFDNYIALWDPNAGTRCHQLKDQHGHNCSIAAVSVVPGSEYEVVSVDFDSIVKLWDVRRLQCTQTFNAADADVEADTNEPLEPRALCMMGKDRLIVGGRRLVVWDRDTTDPKLTCDHQITALAFCKRRLEIVTPARQNLRIWNALSGEIKGIYKEIISSNITALALDMLERRLVVGAEKGQLTVLNYACGATLKTLSAHGAEVSQILCMPGKIITLSAPEKIIFIHDDLHPKKSSVLKRIDAGAQEPPLAVMGLSRDTERRLVAATSAEGIIVWYNTDSGKIEGTTQAQGHDGHAPQLACSVFLQNAPLMITADSECRVAFWSLRPLATFDDFHEDVLFHGSDNASMGFTCMALSASETELFIATDHGTLACFGIHEVVEKARALAEDAKSNLAVGKSDSPTTRSRKSLRQSRSNMNAVAEELAKDVTEASTNEAADDVEDMQLVQHWCVERAHACSIEHLCYCEGNPSVLLTLGINCRVRVWNIETGECLGTLEQGMPDGSLFEDKGFWKFPLDARMQVKMDLDAIAEAMVEKEPEPDEKTRRQSFIDVKPMVSHGDGVSQTSTDAHQQSINALRPSLSAPNLGAVQDRKGDRPRKAPKGQALKRDFCRLIPFRRGGGYELEASTQPYHLRPLIETTFDEPPQTEEVASYLPPLQSGLKRPVRFDSNAVKAAHRLANALGGLGDPQLAQRFRQLQ